MKIVYYKIRSNRKRVEELEKLIEETRATLKEYIDEKETLTRMIQTYTHIFITCWAERSLKARQGIYQEAGRKD